METGIVDPGYSTNKSAPPEFPAGRFESIKLNEPGSFIVNRSRVDQHAASRIARSHNSSRVPDFLADGILECRRTSRPTGNYGLAYPVDCRVPAFLYCDNTFRTVRND